MTRAIFTLCPKAIYFYSLFISLSGFSQHQLLPLNRNWSIQAHLFRSDQFEKSEQVDSIPFHSALQPFLVSQSIYPLANSYQKSMLSEIMTDRAYPDGWDYLLPPSFWNSVHAKIRYENLIIIDDSADRYFFTIDPLFDFQLGRDLDDTISENIYNNTRGFRVTGDIGEDFSFETSFYENQSKQPAYLDSFALLHQVIPGQGRWKTYKTTGYDYASSSGYLGWSPCRSFSLHAGHGKHFIGEGYRSVLLSDNSFNYPYLRFTTSFGRFQYTNVYAMLMNLTAGGVTTPPNTERLFQKKPFAFQYLSWNVHRKVQLGFFQSVIWNSSDTLNRLNTGIGFFNPVIFGSAAFLDLNNERNVMIGMNLKLKLYGGLILYGQYMLDDAGNGYHAKSGYQFGLKYLDVFGVNNLHVQVENNRVRPYAYAHVNTAQSYTHYNQPLAHPLGANFMEVVSILDYKFRSIFIQIKSTRAISARDSSVNSFGSMIFNSDSNAVSTGSGSSVFLQGQKTHIAHLGGHLGWMINPATSMNLVLGADLRTFSNSSGRHTTTFVYFAFRTSLRNIYTDF